MSHTLVRHATLLDASCQIWMSQYTYGSVVSRMNGSSHMYASCHTWMSDTHMDALCHIWMSHVVFLQAAEWDAGRSSDSTSQLRVILRTLFWCNAGHEAHADSFAGGAGHVWWQGRWVGVGVVGVHMRGMTCSYVIPGLWNVCVTWLHVRHGSVTCVTWLVSLCDVI